ncbi:hypothetical protein Tco_0190004 [Tanacetum coccineum]
MKTEDLLGSIRIHIEQRIAAMMGYRGGRYMEQLEGDVGSLHDESWILHVSSPNIDFLLEEFAGELALIAPIPPGIVEANFDPKGDIYFIENLMYDNSFPRPLETLKDDSETVIDFNNDYSSSDNDLLYSDDIDYVKASPPDSELKRLVVAAPLLIHADISLLDLECAYFKSEPNLGDLTSVDPGIRENVSSTTNVNLPFEDHQSPLFAYVVWIFLSFLMYPVAPPYLLSSGNEDTIFDPGISIYHSFMPSVSHQSGTFIKFNVYPNHLNESPMEILSSTCFPMDQ